MITVSILIHEDVVLSSACGPLDILTRTNQILAEHGRPPKFQVELVSEKTKNILLSDPAQFICHRTLAEIRRSDLIIVPAFKGGPDAVLEKNRALTVWINAMHAQGAEIASLCVGCYFLAEAGLLDGKSCTSHWKAIEDLRHRYPRIRLQPDTVLTDQEGIYTGGGAFSSLNLMLYLVEKFCGKDIGVQISKNFSINPDQMSQAHFSVFQGQRRHGDGDILKAQSFIEENYQREISVEQIAGQSNMSKRNFIRRFKKATRNTPLEYLQRVKIEAAKKALEENNKSIGALMYDVGYNDMKTFRGIFKRVTGLTPQAYRKKYCRQQ